jgi:hypothetical protein
VNQIAARARGALELRRQGKNLRAIADHYGISRERARQLCMKAEELERETKNPWFELSGIIRNSLARDGCKFTVDGVLHCYHSLDELRRVPGLGETRIAELQSWLVKHGKEPIT